MSGTINLSMTQQFDKFGDLLVGGKLYFYVAGTVSTPQNAYQDGALSLPWPNPITLDATGRIPQFFLADGQIKIRLTDKDGIVQVAADGLQVIGASSGSGGGGSVDATTVFKTGDLKPRYGTGTHTGWVLANGTTIGPVGSSASQLNDPSAQALFEYLWNTDPNLVVSGGGRGTSSTVDWGLGTKNIALPDWRGCPIVGLDSMGATAAGRLTAATFTALGPNVLGAFAGAETNTLAVNQIPAVPFSANTSMESAAHAHNFSWAGTTSGQSNGHTHGGVTMSGGATTAGTTGTLAAQWANGNTGDVSADHSHTYSGSGTTGAENANHGHSVSGTISGGGLPHPNVQPSRLASIYIKL